MLETNKCSCPYCGEPIELVIDSLALDACGEQSIEYIEDCFVCCRPISVNLSKTHSGQLEVMVRSENDIDY